MATLCVACSEPCLPRGWSRSPLLRCDPSLSRLSRERASPTPARPARMAQSGAPPCSANTPPTLSSLMRARNPMQ